jgi:splicing factor 3B subunit 1
MSGLGILILIQAIGYLIPLMDAEYANYYTREVMLILIREFQSPDEEMKKIVLKVVKQCCATDGVEPTYIKDEVLPPFFKHFWNQRMALDRRNYRQVSVTNSRLRYFSTQHQSCGLVRKCQVLETALWLYWS